jgi:dTDP-4-amino-4,6-dideoxygalactose transaminase
LSFRSSIPYTDLGRQHRRQVPQLLAAFRRVLSKGKFVLSEVLDDFESEFARFCGTRHAVGVNSGTDALVLALKVVGIQPGDEVITVPNSYLASASAIALAGGTVRFVDVASDMNMDPKALSRAITSKTRAIIPVHLTGRPARMAEILRIARRHGLRVIEDAAQAAGANYRGKPVGSWGDLGCFSFHPLKNLNACGDAGAVVTSNASWAKKLKILRNHGHPHRDDCLEFSLNSRLDGLQAEILRIKLRGLGAVTRRRKRNAALYQSLLAGCPQVDCPQDEPGMESVYHTFVIQCEKRDHLRKHLARKGIGTAVHYPVPIHLMKVGKKLGFKKGAFPETEHLTKRILSLPIHQDLLERQIRAVALEILRFYKYPTAS